MNSIIGIIQKIADNLRDNSFDEFWKQVLKSSYASEFSTGNIKRMN